MEAKMRGREMPTINRSEFTFHVDDLTPDAQKLTSKHFNSMKRVYDRIAYLCETEGMNASDMRLSQLMKESKTINDELTADLAKLHKADFEKWRKNDKHPNLGIILASKIDKTVRDEFKKLRAEDVSFQLLLLPKEGHYNIVVRG
jgi:hypothetical protein